MWVELRLYSHGFCFMRELSLHGAIASPKRETNTETLQVNNDGQSGRSRRVSRRLIIIPSFRLDRMI